MKGQLDTGKMERERGTEGAAGKEKQGDAGSDPSAEMMTQQQLGQRRPFCVIGA